MHGGTVNIQSTLGKGSSFTITLPGRTDGERETGKTHSREVDDSMVSTIDNLKEILIVEDNLVNQKFMLAIMKSMQCKAIVVSSGEEAVEAARSKDFDLILMDINLPGIDGLEAMKRIRRLSAMRSPESGRPPGFTTPMIALTAHAMQGDRERFIAQGMDDVISKPLDIEHFKKVLADYIHIGTTRNPSIEKSKPMEAADLERGLMMFGGDKELYAEIQSIFATTYASLGVDLARAIDGGHPREAHRIVHSLRGAAANLGISQVEGAARSLENRFSIGEVVTSDDEKIRNLVALVQATIASIGPTTEPTVN
jgi:CheY-like chemotaxis protein